MQTVLETAQAPNAEKWKQQTALELAEAILKAQTPEGRLAFMKGYLLRHPEDVEAYQPYIQVLEDLAKEVKEDYSAPVTTYGCLMHFQQLSEAAFLEELRGLDLKFTEEEQRKAYKQIMAVTVPELTEAEKVANYTKGSIFSPAMHQLWDDLNEPAGELICDYLNKSEWDVLFESADWLAESVLEPFMSLYPDIQHAILQALLKTN